MSTNADCQRCIAKCAIHALRCEEDAMKGRSAIDCETFIEGDRANLPPPPKILSVSEIMEKLS